MKEWYPPRASHHVFDPYSFCLVVLGLVFHLLWGTDEIDHWLYGFLLALGLELVWEVVGNTRWVVERFRENNGAAGDYTGIAIIVMHCLVHIFQVTPYRTFLETCFPVAWDMFLVLSLLLLRFGGSAWCGFLCQR